MGIELFYPIASQHKNSVEGSDKGNILNFVAAGIKQVSKATIIRFHAASLPNALSSLMTIPWKKFFPTKGSVKIASVKERTL